MSVPRRRIVPSVLVEPDISQKPSIACQIARYVGDDVSCDGRAVLGDLCDDHRKSVLHVEVRPSLISGAGRGLFTTVDRVIGDFICDYSGKLVSSWERLPSTTYTLETDGGKYIVANRDTDGFGRFANDARREEGNNCVMISDQVYGREWADPPYEGNPNEMFLVAHRRIRAGQELFVSYSSDYWSGRGL